MPKYLLAGTVAFTMTAMMMGGALAQSATSDTTSSTTSQTVPAMGSYNSTKSQKTVDSNGVETDKNQTYKSNGNGTEASSSTQTTAPVVAPLSDSTTMTRQTTTTTNGQ
jgi:hypothetical protein